MLLMSVNLASDADEFEKRLLHKKTVTMRVESRCKVFHLAFFNGHVVSGLISFNHRSTASMCLCESAKTRVLIFKVFAIFMISMPDVFFRMWDTEGRKEWRKCMKNVKKGNPLLCGNFSNVNTIFSRYSGVFTVDYRPALNKIQSVLN